MIFYMTVDTCAYCASCPNRLFNAGRNIEVGIGCITSNTVLVIPRAYGKENRDRFIGILKAMWLDITNYELLEQCYVTYDIKCPRYPSYNVTKDANIHCNRIMCRELAPIKYKFMIIFGRAWNTVFPGNSTFKSFYSNGYHILYIPLNLTKLGDAEHIKAVKSKLAKAIQHFNKYRYMRT